MGFFASLLLNPWKGGTFALGIVLVLSLGWGARVDHLRAGWADKYATLDNQVQTVVIATQQASNNPDLKWPDVPKQITALASSNIALKSSIDTTNGKLTQMTADYLNAKAAGDALRSQLTTAQAGRQSALEKLKVMAATPGDRQNCPALLSQTQDALDLAYGSGL